MEKIFDFGFHNGDDTSYYLHKGYDVVALEANKTLYEDGLKRFKKEIEKRRLILMNVAFNDVDGVPVKFYTHPTRTDWSTCDKDKTQYWNCEPIVNEINTVTYRKLVSIFGIPYYIKCDIEGLDNLLIEQIFQLQFKPEYLSFELSRFDYYKIFSYLYVSGYKEFQLINQDNLINDVDYNFGKYSSGKFGKYLDDNWLSFDECLTRYMKYKELKGIDNKNLALGWVDIHAKL